MPIHASRTAAVLAGAVVILAGFRASAGVLEEIDCVYQTNTSWPAPYTCPDIQAVRAPFAAMASRGWQRQNMLGEQHFKEDSAQLNEAGYLKLRWVATQAPLGRRTVYVERAHTANITQGRLDEVRDLLEQQQVEGIVNVQETHLISHGWPGDYSDMVNEKFRASTPDPRLPAPTGDDFGTQ